jgi:histidinol-phosphate aminotransferase
MAKSSSPIQGVKEQVLRVPAYTLRAYQAEIKLNQNENPYDFPAELKEKIFNRYRDRLWSRYPDFVPDALREALAEFAGWRKEGLLVGNGSNELLQAALMVLVRDRTPVAIPSPTFMVYGLVAKILGARVINIPLRADMAYDVDQLILRSEEVEARVLIICSPNNPTGTVLAEPDLEKILERFSGHTLLDEAYYEFSGKTGLRHLEAYPRLIITRTFSKAMGMAGLRVGYLMAHPELAAQIAKAKLPYSVNQFSLIAAQVALENRDRFRPAIDEILRERDRLGKALSAVPGVKVYPSGANFFLFEFSVSPRIVFEGLCRQGILVRDVSSYPMLSRCLRVSVGTRDENDRFLAALRVSLDRAAASGKES